MTGAAHPTSHLSQLQIVSHFAIPPALVLTVLLVLPLPRRVLRPLHDGPGSHIHMPQLTKQHLCACPCHAE